MVLAKKFKAFDDKILELHPELNQFLKPSDQYPELKRFFNKSSAKLPVGSLIMKVIINDGKIVERVFKTPTGQVVSLFSKPSNVILDRVA
tara:strand:- start:1464 stop:1733 length:270 start_codon:yes stop_codon:yes gene_type:complete